MCIRDRSVGNNESVSGVYKFLGEVYGGDPLPLSIYVVKRMLGKVDELSDAADNVAIPYTVGETITCDGGIARLSGHDLG